MKKFLGILVIFIAIILFSGCDKAPTSFSAKVYDLHQEGMDFYMLYVNGDNYRIEKLSDKSAKPVIIYNAEKAIMWELNASLKEYKVTDGNKVFFKNPIYAFETLTKDYVEKEAGTDSLFGLSVEKIEYTYQDKVRITKWVSQKYDFPVKYQLLDKEYKNLVREVEIKKFNEIELGDSLFTIPDDYIQKNIR